MLLRAGVGSEGELSVRVLDLIKFVSIGSTNILIIIFHERHQCKKWNCLANFLISFPQKVVSDKYVDFLVVFFLNSILESVWNQFLPLVDYMCLGFSIQIVTHSCCIFFFRVCRSGNYFFLLLKNIASHKILLYSSDDAVSLLVLLLAWSLMTPLLTSPLC